MNTEHKNNPTDATREFHPLPYRVALLLTVCVFPLIWLGATVTTYAAGMAVPDWPGTYGYNMFLYPISSWISGPFNLLVEHGHRLLASLAGLITIGLVFVTYSQESRRSVRWFAVVLLAVIILQGVLGGVRVLLDARTFARIHGCFGPAFFAMVVGFCVMTSRWWFENQSVNRLSSKLDVGRIGGTGHIRFALIMLILSYLQLCVGSFIRHIKLDSSPGGFKHLVYMHIGLALAVLIGTVWQWFRIGRLASRNPGAVDGIKRPIQLLASLTVLQVCFGMATWVVKYGWPVWFESWLPAANFVIEQKSMIQANIVTAHVATGSLIVAFWVVHFLRLVHVLRNADDPVKAAGDVKGDVAIDGKKNRQSLRPATDG